MDTDRIKDSLTGILEMYPSLAGRMSGDRIICNGAGVLFEYSSFPETSSRDISMMEITGERYGATFDVKAAMAGKSSLMSVKVSRLKDGTLLNVKCSHFCADGDAFYTMVRNWASETRGTGLRKQEARLQSAAPFMTRMRSRAYLQSRPCTVNLQPCPRNPYLPCCREKVSSGYALHSCSRCSGRKSCVQTAACQPLCMYRRSG